MHTKILTYPFVVKETYLDVFGHMNNAAYLTVYEEARWDLITKHGWGLKKILETGLGPTILELDLRFLKELRLRDEVVIETHLVSYERKVGKMAQKMVREGEICSTLTLTFGLFSLTERRLVTPPKEWLAVLGIEAT